VAPEVLLSWYCLSIYADLPQWDWRWGSCWRGSTD
jgi:hypothetical protein